MDASFRLCGAGNRFDVPPSIPGEAFAAYRGNINMSPVRKYSGDDSPEYELDLVD